MESDGPVSAVQIRLAKGEISLSEYKEIITHLMKNVSSFQQTSSLKILQIRYAKSELTSEQYQENLTNLMKNLYSQPWSPPLHILHIRYAEGEINTAQYEEMFANLTQQQFAYDQSTPLWLLNNRYARGELTTPEYEEILSLFNEYTLSLQQSTMKLPEEIKNQFQSKDKKTVPPALKSPPLVPPQERSSLNLKTAAIKSQIVSDSISIHHGENDSDSFDDYADRVKTFPSPAIKTEPLPDHTATDILEIQSDEVSHESVASVKESEQLYEQKAVVQKDIPISDITSAIPSPSGTPEEIRTPENSLSRSSDLVNIPELKTAVSPAADTPSFPSSFTSSAASGSEALPSGFLSLTGKPSSSIGMSRDEAGLFSDNINRVDYSVSKVLSSGGNENGYETLSSRTSHPEEPVQLADTGSEKESESSQSVKKEGVSSSDIRQKIKTLIVKGNYQEAVDLAETMISTEDKDYIPHFYKGMARYYLNIHDQALNDLNHARELCKNKDEIKKIDTIRNHILCKQQKDSEICEIKEPENDNLIVDESATVPVPDSNSPDELSAKLDVLGKKAQDLIDKQEYKSAITVLSEFIGLCSGMSQERLKVESVDEIYAAMGFVRYQLKDYSHAKECFQNALAVNATNEIANNYMKDILIRAARKK